MGLVGIGFLEVLVDSVSVGFVPNFGENECWFLDVPDGVCVEVVASVSSWVDIAGVNEMLVVLTMEA